MRSGVDPVRNLKAAEALITRAAEAGARYVFTPETTHLVQRDRDAALAAMRAPDDDPAVGFFADLAERLGVWLMIGSLAFKVGPEQAVNRSLAFSPQGRLVASYDKIHLFDIALGGGESYYESETYRPGDTAVLVDAGAFKLGLTICYDLRFPHLYRDLAKAGAQVIAAPAAFTRPTGRAHWAVLVRARAIETGAFVVAAAQGGSHEDGRGTWGRSMVADPWGRVIAALDDDAPGVLNATLDMAAVAEARARIPALTHDRAYAAP